MTEKDDQNRQAGEEANADQYNADNDFGLPEAEYSPLGREQPEFAEESFQSHAAPVQDKQDIQPQQKQSSAPMWIGLGVVLLLAGIFAYFYFFNDSENEQLSQQPQQAASPVVTEEEPEPVEEIDETDWEAAQPEEPKEGTVSVLSSRTGRYHLIVGSFIDSDLARDYAQKLADGGNDAKIIEPSGTRKFYRLSVKDAESISALESDLENMRAKYGENVWIVKY